jgi:hypothetical protein
MVRRKASRASIKRFWRMSCLAKPGMVAYTNNSTTWKAEAVGL